MSGSQSKDFVLIRPSRVFLCKKGPQQQQNTKIAAPDIQQFNGTLVGGLYIPINQDFKLNANARAWKLAEEELGFWQLPYWQSRYEANLATAEKAYL